VKITTRNRNLGYGWSNQPVQTPSGLTIEEPQEMVYGGPRSVLRERAYAIRLNGGNSWAEALFVGHRRVRYPWRTGQILMDLIGDCSVEVELEEEA